MWSKSWTLIYREQIQAAAGWRILIRDHQFFNPAPYKQLGHVTFLSCASITELTRTGWSSPLRPWILLDLSPQASFLMVSIGRIAMLGCNWSYECSSYQVCLNNKLLTGPRKAPAISFPLNLRTALSGAKFPFKMNEIFYWWLIKLYFGKFLKQVICLG